MNMSVIGIALIISLAVTHGSGSQMSLRAYMPLVQTEKDADFKNGHISEGIANFTPAQREYYLKLISMLTSGEGKFQRQPLHKHGLKEGDVDFEYDDKEEPIELGYYRSKPYDSEESCKNDERHIHLVKASSSQNDEILEEPFGILRHSDENQPESFSRAKKRAFKPFKRLGFRNAFPCHRGLKNFHDHFLGLI